MHSPRNQKYRRRVYQQTLFWHKAPLWHWTPQKDSAAMIKTMKRDKLVKVTLIGWRVPLKLWKLLVLWHQQIGFLHPNQRTKTYKGKKCDDALCMFKAHFSYGNRLCGTYMKESDPWVSSTALHRIIVKVYT